MIMLVDCSNCRTPLQLPPGASRIRCTLCHSFTDVAAEPRSHHFPHAPPPDSPHFPHAPPSPHYPHFPHAQPPPSSYFPHAPPPHSPESFHPAPPLHSPGSFHHAPPPHSPESFHHAPPLHFPESFHRVPPPHSPESFHHAPQSQSPHYPHAPPSLSPYFPHAQPAHAQVPFHNAPPVTSPVYDAPAGAVPGVHGSKRAVIVGVSYKNTESELKGCINDANCMKYMLIKRFAFPESCILMLNEEESDPRKWPTRTNIRMAMQWLVQGSQPGDSLVFHFSGHGGNQKNLSGDEIDGYDETLLPMDHSTAGVIVDDEINATLVKPLPYGVKLHAIIDACHSGTVLDLPYLCRMERFGKYTWEDHRPPSGTWTGSNGGEVISFTGCDDDQTSADTPTLSGTTWTGAMTYAFIQAIERGHGTTYGSLLNAMRSTVQEVYDAQRSSSSSSSANRIDGQGDLVTTLLGILLAGTNPDSAPTQKKQEPQLTANETFDIYAKHFSL